MLKVFWRYDFILHIKVDHPYISEISYQMNFKTTVLRVPQRKFMYKRSLEMNGIYKGKDIAELAKRMEEMAGTESGAIKRDNVVEAFTGEKSDESFAEGLVGAFKDDKYLKKIENISKHIRRAERISDLLLG